MLKIIILSIILQIFLTLSWAQPSVIKPSRVDSNKSRITKKNNADTIITLKRGKCYGTCPVYKVEIHGNGKLIYEGINYVKLEGQVTAELTKEQLHELISEINKAKYFTLRNSYVNERDGCTSIVSDRSWVYTTIQIKRRRKSIKHYVGCHEGSNQFSLDLQRLKRLEDKIDEIIKIDQWIGTKEERSKFIFRKVN